MATAIPSDFAPLVTASSEDVRRAELRAATKRLHALGVEGEVVVSGTADDLIAYLDETEPKCAR